MLEGSPGGVPAGSQHQGRGFHGSDLPGVSGLMATSKLSLLKPQTWGLNKWGGNG